MLSHRFGDEFCVGDCARHVQAANVLVLDELRERERERREGEEREKERERRTDRRRSERERES
jgi:hypothetical protein